MLEEADLDVTTQAFEGNNNRFLGDEALFVVFFIKAHRNDQKSMEQGRPIYEDREYIQIMQAGNKESIVIRPARDTDKRRFPKQYANFKNNETDKVEGTPLAVWPMMTPSQIEELKYFNIRTVEQLANIADSQAQNMMGMVTLKQQARAYLEACGKSVEGTRLSEEMQQVKLENSQLLETVDELKARLSKLEAENAEDVEEGQDE